MPSFILVHPTVWPQYTNVADRVSCLSVCNGVLWPNGWIIMKLGMQVGLGAGHTVLDGDPAPAH